MRTTASLLGLWLLKDMGLLQDLEQWRIYSSFIVFILWFIVSIYIDVAKSLDVIRD